MSEWRSSIIDAVPCLSFLPETPRAAILLLPDEDWPRRDDLPHVRQQLAEVSLAAVIPEVSSWWLDRDEPEFPASTTPARFASEFLIATIQSDWGMDFARWGVCGIGVGGQGALQLAYRRPRQFPAAAALAPIIDFHRRYHADSRLQAMFSQPEAARQNTATLNLHPLNWPPYQFLACDPADAVRLDGCERLASKLTSIGIPFEADFVTTAAGDLPAYTALQLPRALAFLAKSFNE